MDMKDRCWDCVDEKKGYYELVSEIHCYEREGDGPSGELIPPDGATIYAVCAAHCCAGGKRKEREWGGQCIPVSDELTLAQWLLEGSRWCKWLEPGD